VPKKYEDEEDKVKVKYTPFKVIGDRIYESIVFHSKPKFLYYDNNDKTFTMQNEIIVNNGTNDEKLVPSDQSTIPYNLPILDDEQWKLLQQKDYTMPVDEVWSSIYEQVDTYLDLEVKYKSIITTSIMESYQQHKSYTVGYLFILGDFGSGKTIVIILASKLSYRAMNSSGAHAANVYRFIGYNVENEAQQTLCEDEMNYSKMTPELEDKFAIYRIGYKRGSTVPREEGAGTPEAVQRFYRAFCMKWFAGYIPPRDFAFNSRCIKIQMAEGFPEIDEFCIEDDIKFAKIVMKATIWRMQTYFTPSAKVTSQLRGRMKEIWKPKILAVTGTTCKVPLPKTCEEDEEYTPEVYITKLAIEDVEAKFLEKHNRLEVYVLQNVFDLCVFHDWFTISFKNIWMRTMKDLGINSYDIQDTDIQSIDVPALSMPVSKQKVSKILNYRLRGQISTVTNKSSGIPERTWTFDKEVIERLARGYNIKARKIEI